MSEETINDSTTSFDEEEVSDQLSLVVTWCADDASRVGEIIILPDPKAGTTTTLGRGDAGEMSLRAALVRQRPGANQRRPPLRDRRISRNQLSITAEQGLTIRVKNQGRCLMSHNGVEASQAVMRPGDTVTLRKALQLMCVVRPVVLPTNRDLPQRDWPQFGDADNHGLVGESPAAWALRGRVAFVAKRPPHALITGPSGSGKELVARAIHTLSPRGSQPMVARNAATIPEGLIDAELFGNVKDYPNPGMRERRGLFGEADRSTLFLDEIAEVPAAVQAHLLRALDEGEVHRLGDSRAHRVDVRVLAATNREATALKHDILARFKLRVDVPDLNVRREDVPLLVRHLLIHIAKADPDVRDRFFEGPDPRTGSQLIGELVRRQYAANVRELEVLLWQSIATSPGDRLVWTSAVAEVVATGSGGQVVEAPAREVRVQDLTPEDIQTALDAHDGSVKETWQALGLKNRFQLIRLIKKHGLSKG